MTKLLDKAFAKLRELPEDEQDAFAVALLGLAEGDQPAPPLDEETLAALREGLEQAQRGEFVPDADIDALWKRYGA